MPELLSLALGWATLSARCIQHKNIDHCFSRVFVTLQLHPPSLEGPYHSHLSSIDSDVMKGIYYK